MTKQLLIKRLVQPSDARTPNLPNIPEGQNWNPDGNAFPLPKANKKNKYWRGTPKPIPNTQRIPPANRA